MLNLLILKDTLGMKTLILLKFTSKAANLNHIYAKMTQN